MANEIVFTADALDSMSELQLEALVFANERFSTADRCRVLKDFTISGEQPWLTAIFEYELKNRLAPAMPPFVLGISPEGDTHS